MKLGFGTRNLKGSGTRDERRTVPGHQQLLLCAGDDAKVQAMCTHCLCRAWQAGSSFPQCVGGKEKVAISLFRKFLQDYSAVRWKAGNARKRKSSKQ